MCAGIGLTLRELIHQGVVFVGWLLLRATWRVFIYVQRGNRVNFYTGLQLCDVPRGVSKLLLLSMSHMCKLIAKNHITGTGYYLNRYNRSSPYSNLM